MVGMGKPTEHTYCWIVDDYHHVRIAGHFIKNSRKVMELHLQRTKLLADART